MPRRRFTDSESPRRTVLVAHPGAELFGSDRMLLESVRGFLDAGMRVVVALPARGPLVEHLARDGAAVVVIPMLVLRKALMRPRAWGRLASDTVRGFAAALRLIRRQRPDAVYVSTITIPQWPVAARLLGVRSVTHVHEAEASGNLWVNRLLYLPHAASQRIVTNSVFSLQTMARAIPALSRRSTVILNGVYAPAEVAPPRSDLDIPHVLYVGRLSPRKGPDLAVTALAMLRDRGMPARLTLLGSVFPGYEWYEDALLDSIRDFGLVDAVELLGFIPDVWPIFASADVVVVPSRIDEPFGNTAVEAVLAERAVIASDTSGLREAVAGYDSARLVPPDDPGALAEALAEIIADWSSVVAATKRSAEAARARHSPILYRESVTEILCADPRDLAP